MVKVCPQGRTDRPEGQLRMGENMNRITTRGSDFITLTPLRPKQKKIKIEEFKSGVSR